MLTTFNECGFGVFCFPNGFPYLYDCTRLLIVIANEKKAVQLKQY